MARAFRSILVANRGEIACRVLRTARALGYRTVAVHSQADAGAPHLRMADDAACIGPAPVAESYLDGERILAAARETGCDAVHPGYGFLSENAAFATACAGAGVTFVGPSPEAIAAMGNKARARRIMAEAGIPCVPGFDEAGAPDQALLDAAPAVGFPLLVKAAAGGGGRGMRLVRSAGELPAALAAARSEAARAFGSDELILERAIERPRHVEVQVFADAHGAVVHLGERDCSLQRRHQKVVEEAPCPVATPELRLAMGAAAVQAAQAIGYQGAGTVEFLLDPAGAFYFLEMNTRLQVEHPVTEAITGLDLVALQFRVAEGRPLGFDQQDVTLDGHAIEARLYAEDPENEFLPATGTVIDWREPARDGVRVDSGVETGSEVLPYYDPLLAKVIAWGPTREDARRRLVAALGGTVCFGVATNRDFLIDALSTARFADGEVTTAFIAEEYPDGIAMAAPSTARHAQAGLVQYLDGQRRSAAAAATPPPGELLGWSSSGSGLVSHFRYPGPGAPIEVRVRPRGPASFRVAADGEAYLIEVEGTGDGELRVRLDGRSRLLSHRLQGRCVHLCDERRVWRVENVLGRPSAQAGGEQGSRLTAPMHGLLLELFVCEGDAVSRGDRLCVLEAMKMQHELTAGTDGIVTALHRDPGTRIAAGELILEIGPAAEEEP